MTGKRAFSTISKGVTGVVFFAAAAGFLMSAPLVGGATAEERLSHDTGNFEAQKQEMLARQRRVIFNNDGGDASVARDGMDDPRDFVDIRTTPLVGTHVDTISYCTSRTFGVFLHRTEVGTTLTSMEEAYEHNVVPALLDQGTDPLEVMIEYCHENDIELFWSMRMNDTHDASRPKRFEGNAFKVANPDCLLGTKDNRPRHGGWSAVDYGCDVVRELLYDVIEELCRNYDIDGVELDFFRHPVFFRKTGEGRPVGDKERRQMTSLLRDIAAMAEREGRERGRPFLIAARTPDAVDYCDIIGLEIERWMEEGLIDIWIPSGYFRLRSWDDSVRLGHRYGVKVYAGLSETRVGGGHHAHAARASDEAYRARAMNAWDAGADGVYLFNLFDPNRKIWREMGEPEALRSLDKVYFASVRGAGRVAGGAYPHERFNRIPTVNPGAPLSIAPGENLVVPVRIGEEFRHRPAEDRPDTALSLHVLPDLDDIQNLHVAFNGNELRGTGGDDRFDFALAPEAIRAGENIVEIRYAGERKNLQLADVVITVDYSGALLEDASYIDATRERM